MKRTFAAFCILLSVTACSCGDDGVVFIAVNVGTVASDPDCTSTGGSFDLRDQHGFFLLVVITDDTTIILANGNFGTCSDVRSGSELEVRGSENGDRIDAIELRLR